MIQSGKFDSSKMDIKKLANSVLIFTLNRLMEILGIIVCLLGILLFIALISYSPSDPNFIFPENKQINNFLGFQGSYISDLFFQSIGIISYLVPVTLFFTGINIFNQKKILLIIENSFFVVCYSIIGSVFFSFFNKNAFALYINGNGGFIGNYFSQNFLDYITGDYTNIFYYFSLVILIILFLLSINFNPKKFFLLIKKFFKILFKISNKNYTKKNEIIEEYIPQEEIKNLIQDDLPFIKSDDSETIKKLKFRLPSLELLKSHSKKES